MTARFIPLLALSLLGLAAGSTIALAAAGEKLKAAAEQEKAPLIETLHDMVMIESGSDDAEGLKKMADFTEARLKALGATIERRKTTAGTGADMVIATFQSTGSRKLMLIAHMDTVYQRGILGSEPYRVDGNRIYGPGIADDKGGIAVVLHALKILKDAGWQDYARLTVSFNPDEEVGSIGSGEIIAELADQHDVVLSCEPTVAAPIAKNDGLLLGASGTATAKMEVKGRASHAGAAPDLGRNALIELAHQLQQTKDVAKSIPGTQLNWTTAQAGTVRNQIPERAEAGADIRLTIPDGIAKLQAALDAKVKDKFVPDTETTVTITAGRPPFVASDRGRALAQEGQAIYAEIDRKLDIAEMTGGATDAGYANRSGKAVVVESFGLAGFGYHARDEFIDTNSIVPRLYLMSRILIEQGKKK
ncbi:MULTISPECIES: M20/M25/M40 family metallo-hydrolase [Bradyrhizobium]|uniref:M20/M25/M40 family metallo-hydrolase n=1 Tax=Bradyrhizobium TaxID=374 RepID=UPI000231BDD6|nr:M20/M25/M40 family metallo-hydrolase [Bradyrhizobium japonicum]AJA66435.1 peptidase M20 [Bradyrhizobium japonicum]KMK00316.1 peptidase M20 [Bradyrhizobium japonicum]MBR0763337.1 M20/M25/M40 family metallo-hydrolase [Bradyrhizobium japonicum]MCS3534896.1 glutamate carboxypeptidase [Bradyrhizobium japonicum]MCS3989007.1 glutamate carboxypeptidase [Bradyrhizobium japonicum]